MFLNLKAQPTKRLSVMVGNGNELLCNQICPQVPVLIQGHIFKVDLYVMGLSGADLIFGVEWLKGLGPIVTDYSLSTMTFKKRDQLIELQGRTGSGPKEISLQGPLFSETRD